MKIAFAALALWSTPPLPIPTPFAWRPS